MSLRIDTLICTQQRVNEHFWVEPGSTSNPKTDLSKTFRNVN